MTDYYDPGATFPYDLETTPTASNPAAGRWGKTWAFDFTSGDFVADDDGNVLVLEAEDALAQELRKALSTRRGLYIGWDLDYGNDLHDAILAMNDAIELEWTVAQAVGECLMSDPRVSDVSDVETTVNLNNSTGRVVGTIYDSFGGSIEADIPFRFDT